MPPAPCQNTPHLTNSYGIRHGGAGSEYPINRPKCRVVVGGSKRHIFLYKKVILYNNVNDSSLLPGIKRCGLPELWPEASKKQKKELEIRDSFKTTVQRMKQIQFWNL